MLLWEGGEEEEVRPACMPPLPHACRNSHCFHHFIFTLVSVPLFDLHLHLTHSQGVGITSTAVVSSAAPGWDVATPALTNATMATARPVSW